MNQQQSNKRGHFYSIILALIIGLIGTFWSLHHPRPQPDQPQLPQAGEGLSIYMLPAGEGQCILMTCGGDTLLLDGGSESFGQTAADFLRSQKVRQIDLLVSSSADENYIGGLPTIIKNFPVRNVWSDGEMNDAFHDALQTAGIVGIVPTDGVTFELGDAVITPRFVYGPYFCLEFRYGETSGVVGFAPDQDDALEPVLSDDVTVYVSDGEQLVCLTEAEGS
jgi:hypothetical protein